MSYCVNCGVELEKSEKKCPLCGVEVINPKEPPQDKEPRQRPYPNRIEELSVNINKQFAAALLSVFMVSRLDGSRPWFTTVAVPIVSVVASMALILVLGVQYK